jgi:hypothetical protein
MQQGTKVGGPHLIHDSENSADLLGFGRQHPQIGRNLQLKRLAAVCGLIRAHDNLQLIRILPLLQLINT